VNGRRLYASRNGGVGAVQPSVQLVPPPVAQPGILLQQQPKFLLRQQPGQLPALPGTTNRLNPGGESNVECCRK